MQNNAINSNTTASDELSSGQELLYGQYVIERHMIDGGFGMTYLAKDSLNRKVVIKECYPAASCQRINGEVRPRKPIYQEQFHNVFRSFLREALRMAKFDHPNIVKVHQVFQENNTAYIAMDYVDGMDLHTMLESDPDRLTPTLVTKVLRDTLNALEHVHELGMLHRDISPDNLLLDVDDKLTLIDFGAAREDATQQTRAVSTVMSVKDGYSPHEFYYKDSEQRPASDIYSVGATFYHLITGVAPPDCQKRVAALTSDSADPYTPLTEGSWAFDHSFLRAIDRALSISQKARFQSVGEWLEVLDTPQADTSEMPIESTETKSETMAAVETEAKPESANEVELEPGLVVRISSLVESTNRHVERKQSADAEHNAVEADDTDEEPHLLVDMFGQPIDDIDMWLKEQDKLAKRKPSPEEHVQKAETVNSRKSADAKPELGLFRILNKLPGIGKHSAALAEN